MAVNELLQKYKDAIDICQRHSLRMFGEDLSLKYECLINVNSKDLTTEVLSTGLIYRGNSLENEKCYIESYIVFNGEGMWQIINEEDFTDYGEDFTDSEVGPEKYVRAISSNEKLTQILDRYLDKYDAS